LEFSRILSILGNISEFEKHPIEIYLLSLILIIFQFVIGTGLLKGLSWSRNLLLWCMPEIIIFNIWSSFEFENIIFDPILKLSILLHVFGLGFDPFDISLSKESPPPSIPV